MTETATVTLNEPLKRLTIFDRCDACAAQAWIAFGRDGGELIFCAHHGSKYLDALHTQGFTILADDRERLSAT